MAKYGSADVAFLLVGGYSLLGVTTTLVDTREAVLEDTTALGDSWANSAYTGLRRADFSQEGFFDDAVNGVHAALNEQQGSARVLCFGVEGNSKGRAFVGFAGALQAKYTRAASRGELHKANAEYRGSGVVEEGTILHELATEAAAGNTEAAAVDNAASSANGGGAYLQVTSLTLGGYTNLAVTVRHSADNVTFVDKASFAAVTAAPIAERLALAGAINRYVAVAWSFSGVGSNPSATFLAGVSRA